MPLDVTERFADVASLVRDHRDIIDVRITEPCVPRWCADRAWDDFLLSVPDASVALCEADGLGRIVSMRDDAPPGLVSLVERVRALTRVPGLQGDVALEAAETKRVKARKRLQLSALLGAASEFARNAERIVDVGAGQGHLTRAAARAWDKGALGLDRAAPLIDAARTLASDRRVLFRRWDAFDEDLALTPSDLVMGLHACGEVGDVLVARAAEARARVLLVSCCPQKVRSEMRVPLSRAGRRFDLTFARGILGLANLSQLEQGVEASLSDTMRSRQTRHALRVLLRNRGLDVQQGEEMRGVNRRQSYRGLSRLAEQVLAFRNLEPARDEELEHFERIGREEYEMMRRLSLPRTMLARLIEVAVVLDRAMFLVEQGYRVNVATVFDESVSPRNLGIFAAPSPVGRACS